MATIRIFQVDAFGNRPFTGNPAAVCLLDDEAEASWMQAVAAEMNLSETAFVRRSGRDFDLRWYTPKVEVDLCGHATLAAAHILWTEGLVRAGEVIRFRSNSGVLTCRQANGLVEMDFPATPCGPIEPPHGLLAALQVESQFVGKTRFDYLVLVDSEPVLRSLAPDFRRLVELGARGTIVTAPSDDPQFDFVSRFFAPAAGVDEDPVTGSAHCCLGPFWRARLGKTELTGYQASARGGVVRVRVEDERVMLGGEAVTVLRGALA
jgi:predicted PhzF superfamily epimerase YddE/YHI9